MLDIIILIFLVIHIGKLSRKKGLKPGTWQLYTVIAWLSGEIIGLSIGLALFGINQMIYIILIALPCAFAGFHIVLNNLQSRPDLHSDEINHIGDNLVQ